MNNNRGSLWHKWDLHVHTPDSIFHRYQCPANENVWDKFITDLENLPVEFKAVGINDYLFIDGYEKVLAEKENGKLSNIEMLFPVIEFRLKKFSGNEKFKRINFHVIFSNELKPNIIRNQFLNSLSGKYKLTPLALQADHDWSVIVTKESLEELGKKIKANVPENRRDEFNESDLELGFNNINFDEEEIIKILDSNSYFKGKYLTAIGKAEWDQFEWNDNSISEKKDIINKVNFVFTAANSISSYSKGKTKLQNSEVNSLLLDCSDAHSFSTSADKDRLGNCFTWIKADLTFEGLKQVIYESDRLCIDTVPKILRRVSNKKTRYISRLNISKKRESLINEKWFENINLELNSELIVIIGNKGHGKSALTDIIGLLSNSKNQHDFSFLNKEKFCDPKSNYASNFDATIEWESGECFSKCLSDEGDSLSVERVKYLPQRYLENICSNDYSKFEHELKNVIYNHLDSSEISGKDTLDEIIDQKIKYIDTNTESLLETLNKINKSIFKLEQNNSEEAKTNLINKIKIKTEELNSHIQSQPIKKDKPSIEAPHYKQIAHSLESKNNELTGLNEEIEKKENDLEKVIKTINNIQNIKTELQLLESSIKTAKNVIRPMLTELKLNIDDIIKIELDEGKLDELLEQQTSTKKTLNQELNREIEGTIKNKADKITQEIFDLNESLSLPEKEYQQYLDDLSDWRVILGSINGNKNVKGTLQYYKYSLAQIMKGKVEKEIQLLTRKRYKIVNKIYSQKLKIIETYKALYKPVENFIVNFNQENPNYKVLFDVNFNSNDLINNFFNYVHQGIAGPFYRIEEGKKRFKELVSSTNFDQRNDSLHFLSKVINLLSEHDIHKQLKKEPLDFYNYLFGLTYLEPTYKLKFGNVELNKLSPGERGALLLIFYLLIDKDDKPLILDQPEENLDNESVYKFLVNFIRLAKSKRQIIIITHNPNLAVVCDAEQVIVANIDKSNLNKVSYTTGSIENPEINTKIIDILEGTLKAFDKRGARYSISRVLQRFGSK